MARKERKPGTIIRSRPRGERPGTLTLSNEDLERRRRSQEETAPAVSAAERPAEGADVSAGEFRRFSHGFSITERKSAGPLSDSTTQD